MFQAWAGLVAHTLASAASRGIYPFQTLATCCMIMRAAVQTLGRRPWQPSISVYTLYLHQQYNTMYMIDSQNWLWVIHQFKLPHQKACQLVLYLSQAWAEKSYWLYNIHNKYPSLSWDNIHNKYPIISHGSQEALRKMWGSWPTIDRRRAEYKSKPAGYRLCISDCFLGHKRQIEYQHWIFLYFPVSL